MVIVHYIPGFFLSSKIDAKYFKNSISNSPSRGVADSPSFLLNIQKPSRRVTDSESRFLIMIISTNSKPKAEQLER